MRSFSALTAVPMFLDPGHPVSCGRRTSTSCAVVPVAEEAGVRICLHPDDPPLPEVRGVPRIMNTPAAFDRVLATVPSAYATLGRLFAVGYITGLRDATYGRPAARYGRRVGADALRRG